MKHWTAAHPRPGSPRRRRDDRARRAIALPTTDPCPSRSLSGEREAEAIGRIGFRFVFRCTSCRARFFRGHLPLVPSDRADDLWDPLAPDLVEDAR